MGDRARFEQLFDAHARAVKAYALRRTDPTTAEDVVADTFLICWRRLDAVPDDALPWLYAVARRVLSNRRRAARRADAALERQRLEPPADTAEPDASFERRSEVDAALAALARLPEGDREVLRLDVWEGLSAADGARVVGCSPAAYRVRLHRARRRLSRELGDGLAGCYAPRPREEPT